MSKGPSNPPRIKNRRALHRFEVIEQFEAGIALTGSEVKSLRAGQVSLDEAYGLLRGGEAFLIDMNINHYPQAGYAQHKPTRERKLLLHKAEIKRLISKVTQKGLTLVPLGLHFNDRGLVKVDVALCRGKKLHDKREDLKKRDDERAMQRAEANARRE